MGNLPEIESILSYLMLYHHHNNNDFKRRPIIVCF